MKAWERKLSEWIQQGLIHPEQEARIRAYEGGKAEVNWFLRGLFLLGTFVIGIGLISLIAVNWDDIPDALKLVVNFLALGGAAFWVYRNALKERDNFHDASLLLFFLLCLGSIGLISQIYHSGGRLSQALGFWLLITLPALCSARGSALPSLWCYVLGGTLLAEFAERQLLLFLLLPLFFGLLYWPLEKFWKQNFAFALKHASVVAGLIALFVMELFRGRGNFSRHHEIASYLPPFIVVITLLLGAAVYLAGSMRRMQKILLLATLAIFLATGLVHIFVDKVPELLASLGTLGCLATMGLFHVSRRDEKLFQFYFSLIALRFLVIYFQVFGNLSYTGFGLIFSGLLIIGMGVIWQKYRKVLSKDLERWLNA